MAERVMVATQGGSLRACRRFVVAKAAASATTIQNDESAHQQAVHGASGSWRQRHGRLADNDETTQTNPT